MAFNCIRIFAEWRQSTWANGFTYCHCSEFVTSDYRDCENVDGTVAYIRKLITAKNTRDMVVTLDLEDFNALGYRHAKSVFRFAVEYDGIKFINFAAGDTEFSPFDGKVKSVRKVYLDAVDMLLDEMAKESA